MADRMDSAVLKADVSSGLGFISLESRLSCRNRQPGMAGFPGSWDHSRWLRAVSRKIPRVR